MEDATKELGREKDIRIKVISSINQENKEWQIIDVVHIYIVKADIDGYPYDQLKWRRIQFKRTLADCAVVGRLPEKNLVTPQQAAMEAVKWLERLERGQVPCIYIKRT